MLLHIIHHVKKDCAKYFTKKKISCQQSHVKKIYKTVEKFWKISSALNKEDYMKIHVLNEEKMDMTLAHK